MTGIVVGRAVSSVVDTVLGSFVLVVVASVSFTVFGSVIGIKEDTVVDKLEGILVNWRSGNVVGISGTFVITVVGTDLVLQPFSYGSQSLKESHNFFNYVEFVL